MTAMLDPGILEGMYSEETINQSVNALMTAEVEPGMENFCIGERSMQHLYEMMAEMGWPNVSVEFLDNPLNRDVNSLFGRIIGKAPIVDSLDEGNLVSIRAPDGCSECASILGQDVAGASLVDVESLLTLESLWSSKDDRVHFRIDDVASEISRVDLDVWIPQSDEDETFLRDFLAERSIIIYGGKASEDVYESLLHYGVVRTNIKWIESELGKPPRNPVRHLPQKSSNELIVLILGFMGHSTSGVLKKAITDRRLIKLEIYKPRHIINELLSSRVHFESNGDESISNH